MKYSIRWENKNCDDMGALKRHGHSRVMVLLYIFTYILFSVQWFFLIFSKLKRIICTLLLCNKKYRSPCSFKRKGTFILLLSLHVAWGKFLLLCTCRHSFARLCTLMTGKLCAVGMHNAILRNHLNDKLLYNIVRTPACIHSDWSRTYVLSEYKT